jgi:cytochrome P450
VDKAAVTVRGSGLPGPTSLRENLALTRRLFADPAPVLDECVARYGPTFSFGFGPFETVFVGNPHDMDTVFSQPNESYRWGHFLNLLGFVVGPTSMIVSDGEEHRRRRSAAQPALARRQLDGWIPMIVAETDRMIDERLQPLLNGPAPVDLYPLGKDLVMGITVKAFFGNGLQDRLGELTSVFDEAQAYLELPAVRQIPHRFPHTRRARVRDGRRRFDQLVDAEILRRRRTLQSVQPVSPPTDLLDAFVDTDSGLTTEEIHDQVNTLIGAGYNTTAATIAWTLVRALNTAGVWSAVRAEANHVLGTADGSRNAHGVGPEQFRQLTYASAVVHESLRLHPAGLVGPRQAATDIELDGMTVRNRAMVMWSPYISGRLEEIWPDPLRFDPDRYNAVDEDHKKLMDMAWTPFGRGPRRCIGFALAQMEVTLILARMAQRLDLELLDRTTPKPYGLIVNRPTGGVPVRQTKHGASVPCA